MELRPYQRKAVEATRARILSGARRLILLAPCRAGKTIMAASIMESALAKGGRVLFCAHRRQFVDQCYDKLTRVAGVPEDQVGVIMGGERERYRPNAPVQVTSIAAIKCDLALVEWLKGVTVVILDEAHHSVSGQFTRVVALCPGAILLGLTATPERADGKPLRALYEEIIPIALPSELIAEGWLLDADVYSSPRGAPDLSGVGTEKGDYKEDDLAVVFDHDHLVGDLVSEWGRLADRRSTFAYAVNIRHSQHIVDRFRGAGVTAEHVDAYTPDAMRKSFFAAFRDGRLTLISNCGILTEGTDEPKCKVGLLARGTLSASFWVQMGCRPLTPLDGTPALLLDHAGNVGRHGLPYDDRAYSLDGRMKKVRPALIAFKTCGSCFLMTRTSTQVCRGCGTPFEAPGSAGRAKLPTETDGQLVRVAMSGPEKRATWDDLCRTAVERGYPAGWVWHRYKARIGCYPPTVWNIKKRMREIECEIAASASAQHEPGEPGQRELDGLQTWTPL